MRQGNGEYRIANREWGMGAKEWGVENLGLANGESRITDHESRTMSAMNDGAGAVVAEELPPVMAGEVSAVTATGGEQSRAGKGSRVGRWFWGAVKYLVGVLGTQGLTGAIVVIGWSYRVAQRAAWKVWWGRGGAGHGSFTEFLAAREETRGQVRWPNWFVDQEAREVWRGEERSQAGRPSSPRPSPPSEGGEGDGTAGIIDASRASVAATRGGRVGRLWRVALGSLGVNFRLGMQGILNVWLFTLPGCLLLWFAWYDGWNNSFSKGYEHFEVGPLTGLAGIGLFIAAMLYVPLAQARQAVTGEWRSFYDFGLIARLALRGWLGCLVLAGFYAAVAVPVGILKTLPAFFPQMNPAQAAEVAALAPELAKVKVAGILGNYFFLAGLVVFPAYVLLRVLGARLYARGILRGLRNGWVSPGELAGNERAILERLNLVQAGTRSSWPRLVELIARTGSWGARVGALGALGLVWFLFVAQIFVTEFLSFHPQVGWLNQPLVQVPWFRYMPESVQQPGEEVGVLLLVLAVIVAVRGVRRVGRFLRGGEKLKAQGKEQGASSSIDP